MRIYLFCLAAAAVLASCKKSGTVSPELPGKWELTRKYGGFGYTDSTYAAGNGNIYQFNNNSTYRHLTNGVQDAQGTFVYKKQAIPFAGELYDKIVFDGNPANDLMVTLSGSKLTIGTTVTDGIASDYQKISN